MSAYPSQGQARYWTVRLGIAPSRDRAVLDGFLVSRLLLSLGAHWPWELTGEAVVGLEEGSMSARLTATSTVSVTTGAVGLGSRRL